MYNKSLEDMNMTSKYTLEEIIASSSLLFKNKQVLKPNYTLKGIDDILHRDEEIRTYFEYLKDIFVGVSPSNIFVYGKPGLGKTLITKLVLEVVKQEAKKRGIDLCVININCDEIKTEHAILQKLVQAIPSDEPRRVLGNSTDKHNDYLKYLINHYQGIIILVLDELDKAEKPDMINKIIRTESEASGQFPTIIGITNDLKLRDRFPSHLKSVLCENDLIIKPYDAEQLADILRARVKMAFQPNVVPEVVISLCAAYAAQDYGDVRRAIDLLRVTGELAEVHDGLRLEEHDVEDAFAKIEVDRAVEVIKTLPTQSKTVLLACIYVFDSLQENITANIYEIYKKLAYEIDINVLTQRRVTDLISELNQLGILEGFNDFRGIKGRKKVITRITSKEQALEMLYKDERIEAIKDYPPSVFCR
jgi:cell division control protein 6